MERLLGCSIQIVHGACDASATRGPAIALDAWRPAQDITAWNLQAPELGRDSHAFRLSQHTCRHCHNLQVWGMAAARRVE